MKARETTKSRGKKEPGEGTVGDPRENETLWFTLDAPQAARHLRTDDMKGLEESEAARRLEHFGPNELTERGFKGPWRILWEQFSAAMMVILIIAAVISALLGDSYDAVAILVIVILNALIGFRQEYKAEKAVAALKKLAVPSATVLRNGAPQAILAARLVPGEIVLLEEGNLAPADCRLLESIHIKTQEAALTGESVPVEKTSVALLDPQTPLAERCNMVYMGTVIASGRGRGIVTETGMRTELGRIASMIQTVEREPTPLQRRLSRLGRVLAVAAVILVGIVVGLGLLRGEDIQVLFLAGISLAVAAVPEGLPAVVTIALALGSQRMLKRHALIRKLPAVETLGSITVICTDKTGTLTQNKMTAAVLAAAGRRLDLGDSLKHGEAVDLTASDMVVAGRLSPPILLLLIGGALCNNASIKLEKGDDSEVLGDPTEGALVVAAARMGLSKKELEHIFPRVAELPFDSQRKRMTTIHRYGEAVSELPFPPNWFQDLSPENDEKPPFLLFAKGAVDALLPLSKGVLVEKKVEPLDRDRHEQISSANNQLAQKGMRVLGVTYRYLRELPAGGNAENTAERDLVFIGMVGINDPARPEAKEAVATCKTAGIRPVMITGDHPLAARHIAQYLGISNGDRVLAGHDLAGLSIEELGAELESASVFARVAPEHKLNIVQALQNRGHIVAMTGDGVNDAPALKKADIGVAMGITGTDVSKEVSDMVLLDDNFATIVSAVEEGRVIYDNIRKFIKYLLTTNSGELLVMLVAPFLGMPLPLLPLQILWINLVTDGLPALALGVEPAEQNIMRRPPRRPNESVFSHGVGRHILWVGVIIGLIPLLTGFWYWRSSAIEWQTMIFVTLTFAQMAHVMAIRSERYSLFTIGVLSNKALLGAVLSTSVLQVAVIYVPFLNDLFKTVPLSAEKLAYCLVLSSLIFWIVELEKLVMRRRILY
jgi:Ca2+-transporting ATPase